MYKKPGGSRGGKRGGVEVVHKLPLPRDTEVIGTIVKASGASNFIIICSDEKERVCTIPGRLRRRFWIKEGDTVLVKPWSVSPETKGDIVWRYSIMDRDLLKQKGFKVP